VALGKKRGLEGAIENIENGTYRNIQDVAMADPMQVVRHGRGLSMLFAAVAVPRQCNVTVRYIWGPTGSGKTRTIYRELFNNPNWDYDQPFGDLGHVYILAASSHSSGTTWFHNYAGQDTVIFEEFSSATLPLTTLTSLINPGPCQVPTFGGMTQFLATKIVILSNTSPEKLYPGVPEENRRALMRRLKDPHIGKIEFLGYGPNKDLEFCPCNLPESCHLWHDPSGPVAYAIGAKLPPMDGLRLKWPESCFPKLNV